MLREDGKTTDVLCGEAALELSEGSSGMDFLGLALQNGVLAPHKILSQKNPDSGTVQIVTDAMREIRTNPECWMPIEPKIF